MKALWIGLGGALGTIARYQLDGWVQRLAGGAFPFGTLAVNAIGSFLIALTMQVGLRTDLLSPALRIALTTGVLGGFTTYSTFNYETLTFASEGEWQLAAVNLGATVLGCLVAGVLGVVSGRALVAALTSG
jgi:CrcB protein